MLQFTAMMEGTYFTATRGSEVWKTKTVDCMTGEEFDIEMTDSQVGAVLALAAAGDFESTPKAAREILVRLLYNIAEEVQPQGNSEVSLSLRMIP